MEMLLADDDLAHFVALTADEEAIFRIVYADTLKVEILNGSVFFVDTNVADSTCVTGNIDRKEVGIGIDDKFLFGIDNSDIISCQCESHCSCAVGVFNSGSFIIGMDSPPT